jgi:hypothetical protein
MCSTVDGGEILVAELLEGLANHPGLDVEEWLSLRNWGASAEQALELVGMGVPATVYKMVMGNGLVYEDCLVMANLGVGDAADYYNARVGGATPSEITEARLKLEGNLGVYAMYRRGGKSHDEALVGAPGHWVS